MKEVKHTPEQLPCPFCGDKPIWINETLCDGHYYLHCVGCNFTLKADRRDKVIGIWNTRVEQTAAERDLYKETAHAEKDLSKILSGRVADLLAERDRLKEEIKDLKERLAGRDKIIDNYGVKGRELKEENERLKAELTAEQKENDLLRQMIST